MTYEQKQHLLAFFGLYKAQVDGIWGPASAAATKELQRQLGLEDDGIFGTATTAAVLALLGSGVTELPGVKSPVVSVHRPDWWAEIRYFSPDEFACKCGQYHAPYCDGWPSEMQELVVRLCDRARAHFGVPITIVSGLRCVQHNADSDGVENSQHMYGEAADVSAWGVGGDTVCAWFRQQPEVRYTYRIGTSQNVHFDIPKVGR